MEEEKTTKKKKSGTKVQNEEGKTEHGEQKGHEVKTVENKEISHEVGHVHEANEGHEPKHENVETKTEVKEEKKNEKKPEKKEFAIARGYSLRISRKWASEICILIKGRSPENAISRLEEVLSHRRPVPMASREVPHQRGPGIAGGRYPKNASQEMIKLLKQVIANASVSGVDNPIIVVAKADKASAPFKRGGTRSKRTHVYIEVRDKTKMMVKK